MANRFLYFTKTLRTLSLTDLADWLVQAGLAGADLAVRPGYPVNLDNVTTELPQAVRLFEQRQLRIPLISLPTKMLDPSAAEIDKLFGVCAASGVANIKLGYFPYQGQFQEELQAARKQLHAWARLAARHQVRVCVHTHSGRYIGSNCEVVSLLLQDLDPHHVGAFVDTGHQALGGGPLPIGLQMVARWLCLLAIKDMRWSQVNQKWRHEVVPAGSGIVSWSEFRQAVHQVQFDGFISLHGEYETESLDERLNLAKQERTYLETLLARAS